MMLQLHDFMNILDHTATRDPTCVSTTAELTAIRAQHYTLFPGKLKPKLKLKLKVYDDNNIYINI